MSSSKFYCLDRSNLPWLRLLFPLFERSEEDDWKPLDDFDELDMEELLENERLRFLRLTFAGLRREETDDDSGVELYRLRVTFCSGVELRLLLLV